MENNIWLSVIIPAYNCSNTIERLLDSITIQDNTGVEIIICDDNSTDNFMNKVEPYKSILNIKYIKTKERNIHCPGNTRLDGWKVAAGEWITFIDNDDAFEKDVFSTVKNAIKESGESRLIFSQFRQAFPNGEYGASYDNGTTWLHGKFYNRQFLLDNNINFKENLYSHEDLYFNSQIFSYFRAKEISYTTLNMYTYKWIYNPESLSRSYENKEHSYVETYFKDYIYAGTEPWFNINRLYPENTKAFFNQLCSVVLYAYFYYQSFMYSEDDPIKANLDVIKYLVYRICFEFGATKNDIIGIAYSSPESYRHIYNECISGNCDFIEVISFRDFILNL